MLKKENRLKQQSDFLNFKKTPSINKGPFVIKIIKKEKTKKFGIIVSKRVSKKATKRNEIKRLVSAYLEQNIKRIKPGNYLIIIKSNILKLSKNLIKRNLSDLFNNYE